MYKRGAKKIPAGVPAGIEFNAKTSLRRSAFGELEAAAGFAEAILLTFHHAVVTGEQASGGEVVMPAGVHALQGAGNAQDNGTGLAGQSTTLPKSKIQNLKFH